MQLLLTYAPVMNKLFQTAPISGESWLRIAGVAAIVFMVVEIEKWMRYGRGDHSVPE
jgi:cation-transporting ATPase F